MADKKIAEFLADGAGRLERGAKDAADKAVIVVGDRMVDAKGIAQDVADKAVKAALEAQRKVRVSLYNPLFPDEFHDNAFDLPKMVVIVDEDQRKGIDVCEGAIGWQSKQAGLEVLHLYEEAVPESGINFFPRPECDGVFYIDPFDPKRYVNLACFFDVMKKDKITELRSIAHSLGAKRCRLESYEMQKVVSMRKAKGDGKAALPADRDGNVEKGKAQGEFDYASSSSSEKKVLFEQTWVGDAQPQRPELEWYAQDHEINFLINTRCGDVDGNQTDFYKVEIDNSTSMSITIQAAAKIDAALKKLGASFNVSLQGEAMDESRSRLLFVVEF